MALHAGGAGRIGFGARLYPRLCRAGRAVVSGRGTLDACRRLPVRPMVWRGLCCDRRDIGRDDHVPRRPRRARRPRHACRPVGSSVRERLSQGRAELPAGAASYSAVPVLAGEPRGRSDRAAAVGLRARHVYRHHPGHLRLRQPRQRVRYAGREKAGAPGLAILFRAEVFLPILGLAALALLPVVYKRWRARNGREAA